MLARHLEAFHLHFLAFFVSIVRVKRDDLKTREKKENTVKQETKVGYEAE